MTVTVNKLGRSAWGLDSGGTDRPWWHHAACRTNPNLFLEDGPQHARHAIHICRRHCPVLTQCRADTAAHTPIGVVQAGLRWVDTITTSRTGPVTNQPTDPGCGPWCAQLRNTP